MSEENNQKEGFEGEEVKADVAAGNMVEGEDGGEEGKDKGRNRDGSEEVKGSDGWEYFFGNLAASLKGEEKVVGETF